MALTALGALLILAGIVAGVIILIDAFQNEVWKGILILFFPLYGLYYAFVEFEHEYKWLVMAAWIVAPVAGYLLIGADIGNSGG